MVVNVEVQSAFGYEVNEHSLEIDWIDQMFDSPLEFTGYDSNGQKFRAYLDKNKLELVKNEDDDFVGCIGSITNITED